MINKTYLGDSIYAELENGGVKLTTENGLPTDPSNTIFLEGEVVSALFDFCKTPDKNESEELPLAGFEFLDGYINRARENKKAALLLCQKLNGFDGDKSFSVSGNHLDFNRRTHDQVVKTMAHLSAGKWNKAINSDGVTIDYTNSELISGYTVRFWGGEPPASCKIVEIEVEIPEQPAQPARLEKRMQVVCKDTTNAEQLATEELE